MFRERQLTLLKEAENRRRARRLRAECTPKARSRKAAAALGFLAAFVVASLMLVAHSSPAHADTAFTVNSTGDNNDLDFPGGTFDGSSDGKCDVDPGTTGDQCTLRAAIQEANVTAGADTIGFDIPGIGVKTIHVSSDGFRALPAITEAVTIDGYTQPGASPNTLAFGNDAAVKVELDGTKVPASNGLEISTSDGSVIRGLVINSFGTGIAIHGDSVANRVEGNFLGTDPTGTLDRGNMTDGVAIFGGASETVVGGTTPAGRNVLSGNDDTGVFIGGSNANRIQSNYVGTDKSGTKDLGNKDGGVFITGASGNTVGGTTAASRNVISGNDSVGLAIVGGSQNNGVFGNCIGTTASGKGALGNALDGVLVSASSSNSIGDSFVVASGLPNTVAFNGDNGVAVQGSTSTGNAISDNSVFSNDGLGIDLVGGFEDAAGRTANDPGDVDTGANGLQNKPVLTAAKTASGKTTITGKLASTPKAGFNIQFFSNPSGNEGKRFIGEKGFVQTDESGNGAFVFTPAKAVAVGQTITATASSSAVNTSEFSAPRKVTG
jgi:CSLREA domain-containing protein